MIHESVLLCFVLLCLYYHRAKYTEAEIKKKIAAILQTTFPNALC